MPLSVPEAEGKILRAALVTLKKLQLSRVYLSDKSLKVLLENLVPEGMRKLRFAEGAEGEEEGFRRWEEPCRMQELILPENEISGRLSLHR